MSATLATDRMAQPKLGYFFLASFGIHVLVLLALILLSFKSPRPNFNFNVMSVRLFNPGQMPAGAPEGGSRAAAPVKIEKEETKAKAAQQKEDAKAGKRSLAKDATKEDISKSSGTGVTDADRKRVQSALSEIAREVGRSDQAGVDGEWNALVGGINADFEKRAYYQRAAVVYRQNWIAPVSVPQDSNIFVRVAVRIDIEGNVIDYQVLSWSQNPDFDRSVKRVLDIVKKLPPPPLPSGSRWLTIGIEFTPAEEE